MPSYEKGESATSSPIKPRRIDDPAELKYLRDSVAHQAGVPSDTIAVSSEAWAIDEQPTPDASAAIRGISAIAGSLGATERFKGATAMAIGQQGSEFGLAFISGTMPQHALEAVQPDMVGEINKILQDVQSPYSL